MSAAGFSVVPHLRCLRAVGFYRPASISRRWNLYHLFALTATSTYVLQQLVYAYLEMSDMDKLSKVLFIVLCHITCVAKQLMFHVHAEKIDDLIRRLDDPLFNSQAPAHAALMRDTAARAARLLRWYAGCAVATCVLWIVFPILDRLRGQAVEFPFFVGFSYNYFLVFSLVLLYSFYTTNLVAVGNTTMDAFMATILGQCKTQLQILRMNFRDLPERSLLRVKENNENYEHVLHMLFVDCLVHYRKIIECSDLLLNIFGWSLLVQFGVGGWILCMAAYKIVSLNVFSIEFASTALFIICILTELLLYCYYGNEVTVESDRVVQSVYSMDWLRTPVSFRRSLVVLMERAKRPLRPAAGLVIPLTLTTYITILKSSYSFYAVLRQTK